MEARRIKQKTKKNAIKLNLKAIKKSKELSEIIDNTNKHIKIAVTNGEDSISYRYTRYFEIVRYYQLRGFEVAPENIMWGRL